MKRLRHAVPRPKILRAGLLVILVGSYLFFLPPVVWPFQEPKLLALNVGAALIWWSGLPLTRRPGFAAAVFASVLVLAALAGVAPLDSLLGGRWSSTGLVLLLPCLFLIAALPSLPQDVLERIPRWLTLVGLIVSGAMVFALLLPGVLKAWPDLSTALTSVPFGSTAGNPLFAIGLLSVSLAAAFSRLRSRDWFRLTALGGVALGVALPHQTSSYLLPVVVAACWFWKARPARAIALQGCAVVLVAFVLSFGITSLPSFAGTDATEAGQAVSAPETPPAPVSPPVSTTRSRLTAWRVGLRAAADRPLLGWGTDVGLSGYMANVTAEENASQYPEHGWWDMHNIFIQFLLTTGVVGLLALLFLFIETVPRTLVAPPELSWATAGTVALGLFFLYEPLSVSVLPVLAVLLGVASKPRDAPPIAARRPRPVVGVVLAVCTALAGLALAQSGTFLWSINHGSRTGLDVAAALMPWRPEPRWWSARFGDPVAANETMAEQVRNRPWDPEIRLSAAWVAEATGRTDLAEKYLEEHLKRFPGDVAGVDMVIQGHWPP